MPPCLCDDCARERARAARVVVLDPPVLEASNDEPPEEEKACHYCGDPALPGEDFCDESHAEVACAEYVHNYRRGVMERCSATPVREDAILVGDDWYCEDHARACSGCDAPTRVSDLWTDYSRWDAPSYCDDCHSYCERCDESYHDYGDGCPGDHFGYVDGIRGYGHTSANYWLGGPLPRDEKGRKVGYYLGFELEVTAAEGDVCRLRDWGERHLHDSGEALDFKEDSSVEGFEIVTQPMTPQFFEGVDWESFFAVLNNDFPLHGDEPDEHGLHVHIGRIAFDNDDVALAAFSYLLTQGGHLERIGRREPTHYCSKVTTPVSTALWRAKNGRGVQARRVYNSKPIAGRDAINLYPSQTVEIRAFRSTRNADELRNAVRLVYVAADYIRDLRFGGKFIDPKALHWDRFAEWVRVHRPQAYRSIAGTTK